MEAAIHEQYPLVLEMVKSGTSARQAIQQSQMPRSTFYKCRFVAEMKLVDSSHFTVYQRQTSKSNFLSLFNF